MTTDRMRAFLATYQVGAGVGGLWLLVTQGGSSGPFVVRALVIAAAAGFCLMLIAAGVLLGRRRELGVHLSFYGQVAQLVYLVNGPFTLTYVVYAPATVMVAITSEFIVRAQAVLGTRVLVGLGRAPEVGGIGLNLLAVVTLYLLTTRFRGELRTPKAIAT